MYSRFLPVFIIIHTYTYRDIIVDNVLPFCKVVVLLWWTSGSCIVVDWWVV